MSERWVLGRAGILNVYQYGDEVLHFAGGRLLLRGVNGSGKSTAMNMLLPFLLDGDTRRIDAAGEQSGVLKSWMLTGRDDAQPIGYLWLEVERGGEHLCFGCGIKANRASDTVSTWWWVTSRRPGIDLDLVEDRRPLSMEALRSALDGDPVFRQDQRPAYRSEIRTRLFGGADIDQHIRLLHIVRSPRVGDRVEVDLPAHIHDALPQMSEAALADAAQPLDDLEEHRRNVAELTRTADALRALLAVYADYARAELRQRAGQATDMASAAEDARGKASGAELAATRRAAEVVAADRRVEDLIGAERRIGTELAALRDSPAYAAGRDLDDLRALVARLDRAVVTASSHLEDRRRGRDTAAAEVARAAAETTGDHEAIGALLRDLTSGVVDVGLPVAAPDLPALGTGALDGELKEPTGPDGTDGIRSGLEQLRAAVVHRRGDVDEVRRELDVVQGAEVRFTRAAESLDDAEKDAAGKAATHVERRRVVEAAGAEWLEAVHHWLAELDDHRAAAGLAARQQVDVDGDPAVRYLDVVALLDSAATAAADEHGETLAELRARSAEQRDAADAAAAVVAALDAVSLPPPPVLPWQRPDRGVVLAEVIDFRDGLDPDARAGIEAALEASGLLAAEVTGDGGLVAADGTLLLRPGPAVAAPLGRVLRVADDMAVTVDPETFDPSVVGRLLDGISTAFDDDGAAAVVTLDGRFRLGPLVGAHRKDLVEHVGGTARRAALERQRAEARSRLGDAASALAVTQEAVALVEGRLAAARGLRRRIPRGEAVARAAVEAASAARAARAADELVTGRRQAVLAAEVAHAEAVDKCRRVAANLGLPPTAPGLEDVQRSLAAVDRIAVDVAARLTVWHRARTSWAAAALRWRAATTTVEAAERSLVEARTEHAPAASRLATLEDAVGAEYEEIVRTITAGETELRTVTADLAAARRGQIDAAAAAASALTEAQERRRVAAAAAERCVAVLPRLRAMLAVPGLVDAATDDGDVLHQPVEESPAGVLALVGRIDGCVPAPVRAGVGADGVRQSLRQRRDALGAGWDAEDRQPHESLPLAVEVTGPDGRMPLVRASAVVAQHQGELAALLTSEQDQALRNLLQGMVAREVAGKLRAAGELVDRMNARLDAITTAHGIGVSLRWRRKDTLPPGVDTMVDLLAKQPDLRTAEQEAQLREALSTRLDDARREEPDASYRDLVGRVLDYRSWHEITVLLRRPGRTPERLTRRTALSEGEKKMVSYLPLFAAVAASCDSLAEHAPDAPRFLLLDDAFAKVSEDNHPKLFGLLVELDLDFVATSERLWGTHATVPELAITEVIRDAGLDVIVLEHSRWTAGDGLARRAVSP